MLWIEKVKSNHTVWLRQEYVRPITKLENISRRHYVPWFTYRNMFPDRTQHDTIIYKMSPKTRKGGR